MATTKITNAMVSVNAIQGTLIADNAITTVHIANNAVESINIAENNVTAREIAQNTITVTQLADDAVEADKIADGVITTNHLNKAMISSQTEVAVATGDFILLGDTSDSNNLKKAPISSILAGTLTTAAQTNITSLGTLTGLTTTGATINTNALRLASLDTSVNSGESIGDIEFYSSDSSTGGTGVQAKISAVDDNSFGTSYALSFETGSGASPSEKMRISGAGNVLIGHTSVVPIRTINQRVQISGTDQATAGLSLARYQNGAFAPGIHFAKSRNATIGAHTIVQDDDRLGDINFYGSDGTDFSNHAASIMCEVDGTPGDNDTPGRLTFHTTADGSGAATEHMRIDSSGNVGIGSTSPSSYLATKLVLECGDEDGMTLATTSSSTKQNIYFADGTSGSARNRGNLSYDHNLDQLSMGTAGGSLRFVMDSSGRVGINRTPAITNSKLEVGGADNVPLINVEASGNTAGFGIGSGNLSFFNGTSAVGKIALSTGTLQMTAGALSSPTYSFVGDTSTGMSRPTGSAINFVSGGTEVGRFRSGGLSIGTGDALDANLTVYATHTNDNVGIASFRSQGDDQSACCVSIVKAANSTATSQIYIKFGVNGYNSGGGMITASGSTGAFGTFSDSRLKENISDLSSQLPNILALRPVNFDYKDVFNGGKDQIGFIAQEVETVYPDLVGENEGYKITSGLNKMEARLIKAIQEQQTIIDDLKARIETLEG